MNRHSPRYDRRLLRIERLEARLPLSSTVPLGAPFASAEGTVEAETAFYGTPRPTAAAETFYVGTYHDANKRGGDDSLLCWAASAANLLAYTNWGFSVGGFASTPESPLFYSALSILDYFAANFANEGGVTRAALSWFITGAYNSSYAQLEGSGGGLYPSLSGFDRSGQTFWPLIDAPAETMISRMADYLGRGYGVSAGIGFYENSIPRSENRFGGHSLTVWGYTYDTALDPADPNYYTALILTDSDDGRTGTVTCPIEWSPTHNLYRLSGYGAGTGWLEYFVCLKPTSPLTGIRIRGYNGKYDGQGHTVTVEGIDRDGPDSYQVFYTCDGLLTDRPIPYKYPGSHVVNVVVVRNDYEAVWSAPVQITIKPADPAPLRTPSITDIVSSGRNRQTVSWNGAAGNAGYEIAWSTDGGESWSTRTTPDLSYRAQNLPYGETVLYRVRALGDGLFSSTSPWSDVREVKINPVDIDGDGFVGPGDFALLSALWFKSDGSEDWDPRCDIDGDGFVGPGDFTYISANWFKDSESADISYPV